VWGAKPPTGHLGEIIYRLLRKLLPKPPLSGVGFLSTMGVTNLGNFNEGEGGGNFILY